MNAKRAKLLRRAAAALAVTDAPATVEATGSEKRPRDRQRALHPGSKRGLYKLLKMAERRRKQGAR